MLLQQIKDDMKKAMKERNESVRYATRMILGEIPRLNLKKDQEPTDEQIQKIIRQLIKSENLVCEYSGQDVCDNEYIAILDSYLPKMMSEGEIQAWITDNVNFTQFNPLAKAMGYIMKNLNGKADGGTVKKVLEGMSDFIKRADNL